MGMDTEGAAQSGKQGRKRDRRHQSKPAKGLFLGMKPKILLIADVRGWIFERHCYYISKILGDDFVFNTSYHSENGGYHFDEDAYDLIYPLEFNLLHPEKETNYKKYVTGIRAHSSWWNIERDDLLSYLLEKFSLVHVVSEELGKIFKNMLPPQKYAGVIHHGVDTNLFSPNKKNKENNEMVLGWAGNRTAAACKGFQFVEPLGKIEGVKLKYCGYVDKNLNIDQMADFHNSLDTYVCASEALGEGHNNSMVESACMGNAIVTTINGTVPEYLINEENALIVERNHDAFHKAIIRLRDDKELRTKLGRSAQKTVIEKFDWAKKALGFKLMFERALNEI